jgi:hypothetical protein
MLDLIIDIDDISVSTNSTLLASNSSDVDVVTIEPLVQVHDNQFVLSSGNYSSGNGLVGSVPNWLLTVIQQQLTSGDGNVMSVLSSMNEALDALRLGVAQSIASLNAVSLSQSSLLTALRSDVNANNASILNVLATKVDTAAATAIATNAIQSKFGTDVNAFVGNIASTYVDANSSIAQNMNLLNTTLNGVNTNVSDIATLTTESVPNTLWVDDGNQLDPDTNGNSRYIIQAKAKKQLAIDANGVVTSLLLDSGSAIAITMQADQFKIVASGQSVDSENPFTVDATSGNISFNGIVDFTSTNALGDTTIDGSKITTGSISSTQIAAGALTVDKMTLGTAYISGGSFALGGNASIASNGAIVDFNSTASTKLAMLAASTAGNAAAIATTQAATDDTGWAGGFFNSTNATYSIQRAVAMFAKSDMAATIMNITSGHGVDIGSASYGIYMHGTAAPFTGAHDALFNKIETAEVGDIIVDTGFSIHLSVSDCITSVTKSTTVNQKGVVGIYVAKTHTVPITLSIPQTNSLGFISYVFDPQYSTLLSEYDTISINSLGEGMVNVCGEGGNIEVGDAITTSSTPGKGMKQSDDIIHIYTVAKAREAVTFTDTTTSQMISCIYVAG